MFVIVHQNTAVMDNRRQQTHQVLASIASALLFIHQEGLLHRDASPACFYCEMWNGTCGNRLISAKSDIMWDLWSMNMDEEWTFLSKTKYWFKFDTVALLPPGVQSMTFTLPVYDRQLCWAETTLLNLHQITSLVGSWNQVSWVYCCINVAVCLQEITDPPCHYWCFN